MVGEISYSTAGSGFGMRDLAQAESMAKYVVKAVNVHDDLLEVLARLRNECDLDGLRSKAGFDCWLTCADAAIAKATGAV